MVTFHLCPWSGPRAQVSEAWCLYAHFLGLFRATATAASCSLSLCGAAASSPQQQLGQWLLDRVHLLLFDASFSRAAREGGVGFQKDEKKYHYWTSDV